MRIIYIDIDSLRADHLSCYGYGRSTSPVIDSIAERSAVFTNCHTSDAPCLPSRSALFSGRFGINNGVNCHDGPASQMRYPGRGHTHDPDARLWMGVFQDQGYETVCFSGFGQRHMALWFYVGFTQNFGNQLPGGSENAEEVNAKVIPWLREHGKDDNWFLHVNYWDVHTPYDATPAHYARVSEQPPPLHPTPEEHAYDLEHWYGTRTARDWYHEGAKEGWRKVGYQAVAAPLMPDEGPNTWDNYLQFLNGYDAGIVRVDDAIEQILNTLDALGIRDETAIIISSDHGESIGELGMYFEHGNACDGTTHVPMIIHWPGVTDNGSRHDELIYSMDMAATMLDLLDIERPARWDGKSLAPLLHGGDYTPRDYLVITSGIFSFQRAVVTARYRLIRTVHSGVFPYDPLYLFDMQSDPNQRHNLADECPERVAELDHHLMNWLWQYTTGPAASSDPFQVQLAAGFDPDLYCSMEMVEQRLLDIGRVDQLSDLRRRRHVSPVLRRDLPRRE